MIDNNYYLACGPNGRFYVRSKRDKSAAYSIAAFLAADWVTPENKAALRAKL